VIPGTVDAHRSDGRCPRSSSRIHGTKADGSKSAVRASLTMEHREGESATGTTAERFLTAEFRDRAVVMILPKRVLLGRLAPEELPRKHLPASGSRREVTSSFPRKICVRRRTST